MQKRNYLFRLLAFCLLLGMLPVIFTGLISYSISSRDIERKVNEGNSQILLQTQMRVEQLLRNIELTTTQFVKSPLVSASLNESLTADDFKMINDLSKGMYNLQIYPGIRDVYLINIEKDWMIRNRGFSSFSRFEDHDVFLKYGLLPQHLFWVTNDFGKSGGVDSSGDKPPAYVSRLVFKLPFPFSRSRAPRALLVMDISNDAILDLITQKRHSGSYYLLDDKYQQFAADGETSELQSKISPSLVEKVKNAEDQSGSFTMEIDGSKSVISYIVSPYNRWTYLSVVSVKELTGESRRIALITLYTCLGVVVFVALLALYGGQKMYSPVRRLFEFSRDMDGQGANAPAKDEFAFIEERLRSLSSSGKQLQQQVRGQFRHMKEFMVLKLLMGQIDAAEFAQKCVDYGFPSDWRTLGVLTLQIDTLQETRFRESDRDLLMFAINNMAGDLIPPAKRFSPVLFDQYQVTLVACESADPDIARSFFHEIAELIKAKVYEFLQLKVSIGIGSPFTNYSDTAQAYEQGVQALKGRMNLGTDIILHYDDVRAGKERGENVVPGLKLLEDQIVQALKICDLDETERVFGEYQSALLGHHVNFYEYQVYLLQLISRIFMLIQDHGSSVQKVIGDHATMEQFMTLGSPEEIRRWLTNNVFVQVIGLLEQQAEKQYLNIASQMMKLIHEHYGRDISLEWVASELNFHPVYLSRVFKKETGVNFSEYLTEYRMNIAKSWLETTNMKISEIAEKLSYMNATGFIRTFRKSIGVTPGQYREQHSKTK
ncbi:helix-turn-helix domain-containing protein [Paenibacillus hamazuiensis]|uniref:helix-turn-helix domain-containing protein n=1 Tax=Paenibacillus hamazuiensis TaxID=2936508 RepID=UPI002010A823|nr:helix-turn-helix domain-containing protein [Paenibacillus hamazuiensis]